MLTKTVVVPKTEYRRLNTIARKYEMLRKFFFEDIFEEPPTRSSTEVVDAFRTNKRYAKAFLASFEKGLKESRYFHS